MLKVAANVAGGWCMAKESHEINLLPRKGEGLVTQFLNWALTIGRLLIILTETLALGTFLYRFSLDMRIVDLHDEIKAQSIIASNFKPYEDIYRNFQDRIALAKKYDAISQVTPNVFGDVIEMGQGLVTFRTILIENDSVRIEVQAPSTASISTFVSKLKTYPEIVSVSIDKVENKTSSASINVGITAYLKPTGLAEENAARQAEEAAKQQAPDIGL